MAINFPCLMTDLSDWSVPKLPQMEEEVEQKACIEDIIIDFLLNPFGDTEKKRSSEKVQACNESVKNIWLSQTEENKGRVETSLNKWLLSSRSEEDTDEFMTTVHSDDIDSQNDISKWLLKNPLSRKSGESYSQDIMEPVLSEKPKSFWLINNRTQERDGSVPMERSADLTTTLWLASSPTDQLTCSTSSVNSSSTSSTSTSTSTRGGIEWPANLDQLEWLLDNKSKSSSLDNRIVHSSSNPDSSFVWISVPNEKTKSSRWNSLEGTNEWLNSAQKNPNLDWLVRSTSLAESRALEESLKDAMEGIDDDHTSSEQDDESSIVVLDENDDFFHDDFSKIYFTDSNKNCVLSDETFM